MKAIYLIFLMITVFTFFSCSLFNKVPDKVVLKHPTTHEFVNCNVDQWKSKKSYEENDECVKKYQKQGYVIWATK